MVSKYGGERGIRTLDELLTHTPLAGERLQPLGHLSVLLKYLITNTQTNFLIKTYWLPILSSLDEAGLSSSLFCSFLMRS